MYGSSRLLSALNIKESVYVVLIPSYGISERI